MRSEFEFIEHVKSKHTLDKVGDDCAVLPKDNETDLLMTSDLLIEDIDFLLEWTTPEFLGHKALAVSLSDIAAMGGTPRWALLSLGVSEKLWKSDFLDRFYAGWHDLAGKYRVELVGGDVSRSPSLVIDSVVGGEVSRGKAIMRCGATPGDAVFVTGFLGGAAAGLHVLEQGHSLPSSSTPAQHLLHKQLQPIPQVTTANLLNELGLPTAMLDISDGLSSDLQHLVDSSDVGARIDRDRLPVDPAIALVLGDTGIGIDLALHGGEDFELLFTTAHEKIPIALDLGFYHIGEVTADKGRIELITESGPELLLPKGFQHF